MIQIFGRRKCRDSQAAERFFKDRSVKYQFIDMDAKAPSPGELDAIAKAAGGYDALLDRDGKAWQDRGAAWLDEDPRDLLLDDPALLRSPLVRSGKEAAVGRDEKFWARLAAAAKA